MMISRKRRKSPIPTSSDVPSKRARILSNLWQREEDITVDRVIKTSRHQHTGKTPVFDQGADEIVIDREDDRFTRRKYGPDRHSRSATTNAIVGARRKERAPSQQKHLGSLRRKKPTIESVRSYGDAPSLKSIRKNSEASADTCSCGSKSRTSNSEVVNDLVSFSSNSNLPNPVVQISQHSSFDPEQYILYKSSLSTQGILSQSYPASALDKSSSSADISASKSPDRNRIIPDSQSLAGSSSYISSSTENVTSSNLSAQDIGTFRTPHTSSLKTNSLEGQLTEGFPSSSTVPSQGFTHLHRSKSAPSQIPSVNFSDSFFRATGFVRPSRSQSDPIFVSSGSFEQTSHQTLTPSDGPSSNFQESSSDLHRPDPAQVFGRYLLDPETEFQTQAPLSLSSQATQTSTEFLEENWQSAQIVPDIIESASQNSFATSAQTLDQFVESGLTYLPGPARRETLIGSGDLFDSNVNPTAEPSTSPRIDRAHCSVHIKEHQTESSTDLDDSKVKKVSDPVSLCGSSPSISVHAPNSKMSGQNTRVGSFSETTPQNTTDGRPTKSNMPERIPPRAGFFTVNPSRTNLTALSLVESISSERDPSRAPRLPSSRPGASSAVSPGVPAKSLREKLREMRANSRANATSRRSSLDQRDLSSDTKSPSLVPEKIDGHIQEETRLEVRQLKVPVDLPLPTLPMRAIQPPPHTPTYRSKLSHHTEASYPPKRTANLTPTHLKEMEFVVPLSMSARIRDQYVSTIGYYQRDVENFMEQQTSRDGLLTKVRVMLDRVKKVTTHVDLDGGGGGMSQGQEEAVDEAVWAETCSAKFLFLRHFMNRLRYFDLHIAIVAQPGQLHDILETFLKGTNTKYSRPATVSRSEPNASRGRLDVTLIASGEEGASALPKPANLIIAFDSTFNAQDVQVGMLRRHLINVRQLSPVIHLLVYKSAEHIERCIPESMDPIERLRLIVSCIIQTRHDVGQLLPDEAGTTAVAEEVAAFLEVGGQETNWTFPSIRPIEDIEGIDPQDLESSNRLHMEQNTNSQSLVLKRAFDNTEYTSLPLKRQRSTPVGDVTHISDSINQDSQSTEAMSANRARDPDLGSARADKDTLEDENQALRAERDGLKTENNSLKNDMAFMKSEQEYLRSKEQALKISVDETEQRRKDLDQSLNDLQFRFETKNKKVLELRHEMQTLNKAMEAEKRQQSLHAVDIAKLTNSRALLEQEVKSARAALRSSDIPGIAQFEALNEELRSLSMANTELEKKKAENEQEIGYMREQYQHASTAAAEAATHVATLKANLAEAEQRALGESARLAQINQKLENRSMHARIGKLELELVSRERLLQKQAEELRSFQQRGRGAGGVVTRGNSVQAKSPRDGSRGGSPGAAGAGAGAAGSGYGGSKVGGSGLRYGGGVPGEGK